MSKLTYTLTRLEKKELTECLHQIWSNNLEEKEEGKINFKN